MDYCSAKDLHQMVGLSRMRSGLALLIWNRLNTKIEPRELVVVDLVKDLSDGVSICPGQVQLSG